MDYKYLIVEEKPNGVVLITLSREKSLNALNSAMLKEIHHFFSNVDEDVRCIIITGAGKSFVAGADIAEMANFTASEAYDFAKMCIRDRFTIQRKLEELFHICQNMMPYQVLVTDVVTTS